MLFQTEVISMTRQRYEKFNHLSLNFSKRADFFSETRVFPIHYLVANEKSSNFAAK